MSVVDAWLDGEISTEIAIHEGLKSDNPSVRLWAMNLEAMRLELATKKPQDYLLKGDVIS